MGIEQLFCALQFADSALPIGGFSFSMGLESAVEARVVTTVDELKEFVESHCEAVASTDCVAALSVWHSASNSDFRGVVLADRELWLCRTGHESRRQSQMMGHKLAQLAQSVGCGGAIEWWCSAIERSEVLGLYPTTLALLYCSLGVGREQLFSALIYGAASQMLSAALRLTRFSHIQTQQILFSIGGLCQELYGQYGDCSIDDICQFSVEQDILRSMHERGRSRLFMS